MSLLPFKNWNVRIGVPGFLLVTGLLFCTFQLAYRSQAAGRPDSHANPLANSTKAVTVPGTNPAMLAPDDCEFTVNSNGDDGDIMPGDGVCETASVGICTLRAAIQEANAAVSLCSGTTDINFSGVASPINLASALPDINHSVNLNGPGANLLTVMRGAAPEINFHIFRIMMGNTVSISGLTLTNGYGTAGLTTNGGGILNEGTLTMSNSVITGNTTDGGGDGGGIFNTGTLTMTDCSVSGNTSSGRGGGIFSSATMILTRVTVSNNSTVNGSGPGGGIYSSGAGATLTECTVSGNQTGTTGSNGYGGGIFNQLSMTIIRSTISGNAGNYASAIMNKNSLVITNSSVTGNQIQVLNNGGAIANEVGATMAFTNDTITGNTGFGVINDTFTPALIRNTIVAGNDGFSLGRDVNGPYTSQGHNLIGNPGIADGFTNGSNGDQVGTPGSPLNPRLGPLANNGGLTLTHALLAASPALDAGDDCVTQPAHCGDVNIPQLTTDQRGAGFDRIVDGPDVDTTSTVDIGAFEAQVSVEDITDKTVNEDTQLQFTFNVGGAASITSVVATSGNTTLVPNNPANIDLSGSGSTRTLTINPAANQFGTATITVTVNGASSQSMTDTFVLTVNASADTPSVTPATTNEDNQTTSGLVISRSAADGAEITHFKITGITNGTLFKGDGTTAIANNSFITFAEGNGGLKFTPAANLFSPSTTFSFQVQASLNNTDAGLGGSTAAATITVTPVADTPSVTNATTNEDTQTTLGLLISRNAADGAEVTHFRITGITNGTLFKSDGTTAIPNNSFITFVEGSAGLKFTPAANQFSPSTTFSFQVQGATSAAGAGLSSGFATATITVNAVADTPSLTNATTNEDIQTTSGLVISRNSADAAEVTHLKVTNIANGTLFKNNGTTQINNNDFITVAEGNAGLKFTPAANLFSPSTNFSFQVQGATSAAGAGLSSGFANATITVNPVADTPSVTNATTTLNTQTTSGLIISRNPADGAEVTHFKVTNIQNGTLFKNNGTTPINNNDFITFAEGNAGLKFTPASNLASPATTFSFQVQAATSSSDAGLGGSTATATITVTGSLLRFSSALYNTTESSFGATITVERVGDSTSTVKVDYGTPDDSAAPPPVLPCATPGLVSSRCDFTTATGTLTFAPGDTAKTFTVLISQDNFVEGPENVPLTLSNVSSNAVLGSPATATLTIADDLVEPVPNPIDDASNFVRQHYHDFLNREPDAGGLAFWTNEITSCGTNQSCISARRVNVSASFFLSIEFQNTGYLVERLYKASYGEGLGTSTTGGVHQLPVPIVRFNEFLPDTQKMGQGVIVGQAGWETILENNKQAFVAEFVQRARFTTAYANTLTPGQFVDALFANAGVTPTPGERQAAVDEFGGAGTSANAAARGRALRRVAENGTLAQLEFNRALVLMQYFGYLRRNPNAAPDSDYSGFDFWLAKLNQFTQPGDDPIVRVQKADMVKAFINSTEYQTRFGFTASTSH